MRIVVGELATSEAVSRILLSPLSLSGVAAVAGSDFADVESLYRRTGGNPFFVTEVLAASSEQLPMSVRDAVLARVARLDDAARSVLNAVAVVPLGCEYWLLEALAGTDSEHLDRCLAAGVLLAGPSMVGFRHELGRLAVLEEIPPARRVRLHQTALAALEARPSPDPARLTHHAAAAGDGPPCSGTLPRREPGRRRLAPIERPLPTTNRPSTLLRTILREPGGPLDRRAYACYLSGDFPPRCRRNVRRSCTTGGPRTGCA